jgi:hypothetical protein
MIPNHILILGSPHTGKLRTVKIITTRSKSDYSLDPKDSHSGLIVKTDYSCKYFNLDLNVLIDEFPDTREKEWSEKEKLLALEKWYKEFLSEECDELRQVLNGVFLCINTTTSLEYIKNCLEVLGNIRENIGSDDSHGFIAIIGTNENNDEKDLVQKHEEIEDLVLVHGFEYLNLSDLGYNEYKEKIGKDRLLEILDTHDWDNIEREDPKYEQNKLEKLNEMTKGLLDDNEDHDPSASSPTMDLNEILLKLQIAKENIHNLDSIQKEEYINKVIADVIDYI